MKRVIEYTDGSRDSIIAAQKVMGFLLIEDQLAFDGKRLIFKGPDVPTDIEVALAAEIDDLKTRVDKLEKP